MAILEKNSRWYDTDTNNSWDTLEDLKKYSGTLKNCLDCSNCSNCSDCTGCSNCSDCSGCLYCSDCSGCLYCSGCTGCTGCLGCISCSGCSDCSDCSNCSNFKNNPNKISVYINNYLCTFYFDKNNTKVKIGCFSGSFEDYIIRLNKRYPNGKIRKQHNKLIKIYKSLKGVVEYGNIRKTW